MLSEIKTIHLYIFILDCTNLPSELLIGAYFRQNKLRDSIWKDARGDL